MSSIFYSSGSASETDHAIFMQECLALAREAAANGESPVGSVIVRGDKVIARGIEAVKSHNDFTYHAEIECIRQAAMQFGTRILEDCRLYSTHEPCIMCSYVIRQSRIPLIIFGRASGEKGGLHSRFSLLSDKEIVSWGPPPVIVTGILEKDCLELK